MSDQGVLCVCVCVHDHAMQMFVQEVGQPLPIMNLLLLIKQEMQCLSMNQRKVPVAGILLSLIPSITTPQEPLAQLPALPTTAIIATTVTAIARCL